MQSKTWALPQHAIESATKCCKLQGTHNNNEDPDAMLECQVWPGVKLNAMGVSRSTKEWEIAETGLPWPDRNTRTQTQI